MPFNHTFVKPFRACKLPCYGSCARQMHPASAGSSCILLPNCFPRHGSCSCPGQRVRTQHANLLLSSFRQRQRIRECHSTMLLSSLFARGTNLLRYGISALQIQHASARSSTILLLNLWLPSGSHWCPRRRVRAHNAIILFSNSCQRQHTRERSSIILSSNLFEHAACCVMAAARV